MNALSFAASYIERAYSKFKLEGDKEGEDYCLDLSQGLKIKLNTQATYSQPNSKRTSPRNMNHPFSPAGELMSPAGRNVLSPTSNGGNF